MRNARPPHEWIDNDGPQGKPASLAPAFGRHVAMAIAQALTLLVEVRYRPRAQLVKEPSHLHPSVGVWVRSTAWWDHDAACGRAAWRRLWIGLGRRAHNDVRFGRQRWPQPERARRVGVSRGRQFRRHGNPPGGHHRAHVQLPPVDPAVPARLGPGGLGSHRGLGPDALCPMVCVPHPAVGPQDRAVHGDRPARGGPRGAAGDQAAAHTADWRRPRVGSGGQAALPGAPCGQAAGCRQQRAQKAPLGCRLVEHAQPCLHPGPMPDQPDDQGLQKQAVRRPRWPALASRREGRGPRHTVHELDQGDQKRVSPYPSSYRRFRGSGSLLCYGGSRVRVKPERGLMIYDQASSRYATRTGMSSTRSRSEGS
jgi:hypothetical protein